jgi:hypothetical protein
MIIFIPSHSGSIAKLEPESYYYLDSGSKTWHRNDFLITQAINSDLYQDLSCSDSLLILHRFLP